MALQGRVGLDHQHLGMEGGDQPQLLAVLVLADMGDAEAGQVRILRREAGRRCLAARIGIGARVQHHHLDRRAGDQHPGQGAEPDVVHGAVPAHADDARQQAELLVGELLPAEGPEESVVDLRVVVVLQIQLRGAQGLEVLDRAGAQALENPLGHGYRVLEQAVHPRVRVGIVREGRGVDAAAAGGVGDRGTRAGRGRWGRSRSDTGASSSLSMVCRMRSSRSGSCSSCWTSVHLGVQALDQVLQLADVIPALTLVDRPVGRHQHAHRGHLAAAAAGTVSAGHGVVVVAIENQTLGVAPGFGRVLPEARRGVVRPAQELELVLKRLQNL